MDIDSEEEADLAAFLHREDLRREKEDPNWGSMPARSRPKPRPLTLGPAAEAPVSSTNASGSVVRPGTSRITFLDLPEHVQIRIFQYAWLLRPCPLDLGYEKHRTVCQTGNIQCNRFHGFMPPGRTPWLMVRHIDCRHPRLPTQLFAVSRAMREQAGAIFFKMNRFNIKLDTVAQFRLFRSATEWGVHHIRRLHVDMGPAHNRYLGLGVGIHSRVMKTWAKFCQAAAEGMPSLRHFSLKCRVREFEVACKMMVAMDPFPLLSNCAIHMMT